MENDPRPGSSIARTPSIEEVDMDFIDQLFSGDGWLDFQKISNSPTSPFRSNSQSFSPPLVVTNGIDPVLQEGVNQDETQWSVMSSNMVQLSEFDNPNQRSETSTSWFIQQSNSSLTSLKDRFKHVLKYIKETQIDADVLVQFWVPMRRGDQLVLTTYGQPHSLNPTSEKLINFRDISTKYEFSAEVNSENPFGLPGRVFVDRLPEWTPDVRFFTSYEYPRVGHAQKYDVHSSIGLPLFEQGSYSCQGVVEVIMTSQKTDFNSELNTICSALQAVNLRSSEVSTVPRMKFDITSTYEAAIPEILQVLRAACHTHKLPLAQTWVPCSQQEKRGSRHSDENYMCCISTVDAACYVNDPSMWSFHKACSEHHLLMGQGVAGQAFTTNQPCFLSDVAGTSKLEYPLSHHAKLFNLKGCVAIRLRCTHTGTADFVLELFLPTDCIEVEEQKVLLDLLSSTVRSVCRTLRVVADKELDDEAMVEMTELNSFILPFDKPIAYGSHVRNEVNDSSLEVRMQEPSNTKQTWTTSSAEESQKETNPLELRLHGIGGVNIGQSKVLLSAEEVSTELRNNHQSSSKEPMVDIPKSADAGKAKRHTKAEKTVSLQTLRQYFAGTLKDAAKSLKVCPTTLKRICRQHGITRWPSRKIKKVGHSLKKLQLIIDSVHGGDAAIQLNSLYKDMATVPPSENNPLGSDRIPPVNQDNHTECKDQQYPRSNHHTSSSGTQDSNTSPSCSGGSTEEPSKIGTNGNKDESNNPSGTLRQEHIQINEHLLTQDMPRNPSRAKSQRPLGEHLSSIIPSSSDQSADGWSRVKATYGTEKVRFRLKPSWNFEELKQEIAKRFNIGDTSSLILKYLDDDVDWVLLTCDDDLQECIHVQKSSNAQTITISVQQAASQTTGPFFEWTGLS